LATRDKKVLTGIPEDLVLDESFDKIFQLKGFDLKTGKIKHQIRQSMKIKLEGDGATYLWTKNALERCGYEVSEEGSEVIQIKTEPTLRWLLNSTAYTTIESLINGLKSS
jgi:iron complex transport system ATP-binding protein